VPSEAKHLSVSIGRPPAEVYEFLVNPENLPRWAAGLSGSIANLDGEWIADSPLGRIKVQFVPRNEFGVLDHDVTLPSGEVVTNPMRVLPNGDGSEVVFTLFRRQMTAVMFADDAAAVLRDLQGLKDLLEG